MTSSTPPTSFWQRVTALLRGRTPPEPSESAGDREAALPLEEPAFSEAMAERFRAAMPGEAVAVAEPYKLSFATGGATVNLGRIWHHCRANPHGFEDEVSHFVAATANALRNLERPPERSQLRLSLQRAGTAQAVLGRRPELGLQVRPFVDGLVSVVVLDSPTTMRWAGATDMAALNLEPAELLEIARHNTRSSMQALTSVAAVARDGRMLALETDGSYTASRILFPEDWAPLAKAQGGTLIVAAPATTTVLYIGQDDGGSVDALRDWARDCAARACEPLGEQLLRWTAQGWKPVE